MKKTPQESESRSFDKYIVRFPDGMRECIAEAAKASNRSMNAEIVARLQASFEPSTSGLATAAITKLLDEQYERLMALVREAIAVEKSTPAVKK